MPSHSLCSASGEPHQPSYSMPSTPLSPPLHLPRPAHDIKKIRNTKQLSLKVSSSSHTIAASNCSNSNSASNLDTTVVKKNNGISLSMVPPTPSSSFSTRRPFTPAPLLSASLTTPSTTASSPKLSSIPAPTSKRHSQLLLDDALPAPRLPLPATSNHRSISAYFSDYSLECGAASPYTTEPVCVLPNLYLGAEHNATDTKTLRRLGITFVLNVAIEIAREDSSSAYSVTTEEATVRGGITYRSLSWSHHQKNLLNDFPKAFELIDESLACNNGQGKALVHCQLGVSRSASLVIAYVMRSLNMGLTEAYDFVKQRSGVISPNMSLMYQLAEYEKRLKNPSSTTSALDSTSDTASVRSRNSWSSQLDDDEPPYPFSAAFSASNATGVSLSSLPPPSDVSLTASHMPNPWVAMTDSSLPPATPMRQEFCKRPLTPDNGSDDHPNTKPFQGPSRLGQPKPLSPRRGHLGLTQVSWMMDHSRPRYQSSPLTTSMTSETVGFAAEEDEDEETMMLPKTPTAENFTTHSLEATLSCDVEMVPPTPLFQSSFMVPSLSCSSTCSSASSVLSFEACPRHSISSTSSSTATYFTACDDEDVLSDDHDGDRVHSPRNSGTWSFLPILSMSSSQDTAVVNHDDQHDHHHVRQQQDQERLIMAEPKRKRRMHALWSGLKALHTVTETASTSCSSSSSSSRITCLDMRRNADASPTPASPISPPISTDVAVNTATSTASTLTITPSKSKTKGADIIFSPRPYTPARHGTRSLGEFYQALFA